MVRPFKALLVSDVKTPHSTGLTLGPITHALHHISFLSFFCAQDMDFSEISFYVSFCSSLGYTSQCPRIVSYLNGRIPSRRGRSVF